MKKLYSPLVLGLISVFSSAQEVSTLPQVVVTASRPIVEELAVDSYSGSTATVGEAQLRDQHAVDVAAALRRTPGVQIARYNPVGSFGGDQGGAIFIRGLGVSRPGSEIKTYIDGIPFYMGVWNHPLLDLLPVNGMRAITVHKSPQPYLSGNNFASLELASKKATQEGWQGNARLSAGSFGTLIEQIDLTGKNGDWDYMLAQGHAQSNGHRNNADGELNNVMSRVGYKLNQNWSMSAQFLYTDNKARDPGDNRTILPVIAPQYNTRASMVAATLSHTHDDWRGEIKVYRNAGNGDWLSQPMPDGDTLSHFELSGLRWREQFSPWVGGKLIAGIDDDKITGDVAFNRISPAPQTKFDAPSFRLTSPYVAVSQDVAVGQGWLLTPSAGVRYYKHNNFASKAAPHAGLTLSNENWTLFANMSRGVNYPGLEAPVLASLIPPLGASWKNLSAEELLHKEVGIKYKPANTTQIEATLFNDDVKNRYVFGFPPHVPPPPQFINLGAYRMQGAELALRHEINRDVSVFTGLTWLNPSIEHLPYTPKKAWTLGVNGKVGPIIVVLDTQYQSNVWALNRPRAADAINMEQNGAFAVTNTRLSYPMSTLGKKGEVFVVIENLFDRDYAYRPGYPMPGRWVQLGVSASF